METVIDGININYICEGEENEQCVVMLHGWASSVKPFKTIIDFLSSSFKVYALDMPGFGESHEPTESWNVDSYVDFVLKFIEDMNIERAVLIGHSFGGRVIIKMVNRHSLPFEPTKIVLIDSAGILPKKTIKQKAKIRSYKIAKALLGSPPISKLFPNALDEMRKKSGSADYNNATPIMRQTLVKVVNEDLTYLLETIKQPTLLIWGENDTATPISDAKLMEQKIPDAGLVTLKGAGHFSFLEQPGIVNSVLNSFLNS